MNTRAIELYKQAIEYAYTNIGKQHADTAYFQGAVAGRFAELIVRECAELSVNSQYANTKNEYYEGFNEALIYVGNKIKEHFGVEE